VRKLKSAALGNLPSIPPSGGHPSAGWARIGLCALALIAYGNSFGLGLTTDARAIVASDVRIRSASAANLSQILNHDYWWPMSADRLYRPVTLISFLWNYAVMGNGDNGAGYHVANFLLHAINVLLVYELALLLFRRRREPAFFAAALWAVHPIHTECVTNVAGRADLLAAMAVLAGLLLYTRMNAWTGGRRWLAAAGLFAIATLGEFSKENAAVLVGVLLLWDLSFGIGQWREGLWRRIPAFSAATAALLLLWWMRLRIFSPLPWPESPYVANPLMGAGFWTARLTALKVIGLDLWLLACPIQLSSDRSFHQIPLSGPRDIAAWAALLLVSGVLTVAVARHRRDPLIFWTAGFAGLTLLPTSNLLFPIGTIMAERFLYLPCIAFVVALVALVARHCPPVAARIALALLIAFWTGRTLMRNPSWDSNLTLAQADVETAPASFGLHERLAAALFEQDPQGNLDRAIHQGETAWRILRVLPRQRQFQQTPANLGAYYRFKGDALGGAATPQGRQWYEKALGILQQAREVARAAEKSYDEAQLAHHKPLGRRTAFRDVYFNLGAVYALLGRYPEALDAYRYGRLLDPGSVDPYDEMSAVYRAEGDWGGAAIMLHEKSLLEGDRPATMEALRNLYDRMGQASCAFPPLHGGAEPDFNCARVSSDVCQAAADLSRMWTEARNPERAAALRRRTGLLACPALAGCCASGSK
jgi:tetratricopeptide (TPR) repeat protein